MNTFNIPSVDHLIENVHYRVVDWNFAEDTEANLLRGQNTNMPSRGTPSTFAEECEKDERMIYGKCRKTKKDGDWDSSKKTKGEEEGEAQAKKEGSEFKNNKMIKDVKSGKKLGWAMKNGKPVLVEWGSVAGEKKVGPKPTAKPQAAAEPKEEKKKEEAKPADLAKEEDDIEAQDPGDLVRQEKRR